MAKNLQPFRKNKTDGTPQIYKAYFVNAVREILSSGERLFKGEFYKLNFKKLVTKRKRVDL